MTIFINIAGLLLLVTGLAIAIHYTWNNRSPINDNSIEISMFLIVLGFFAILAGLIASIAITSSAEPNHTNDPAPTASSSATPF